MNTIKQKGKTDFMKKFVLGLVALSCLPQVTMAEEINFSVSGGWPFILTPTVSTTYNDMEFYANYKIGADDGFALGVEKQYGNHALGVFVGAVGARDADYKCDDELSCPTFRIVLYEGKTTQGVGMSYEYRFNTSREGWALRLEAGYGKESKNNSKRFDGNVQVVYHF